MKMLILVVVFSFSFSALSFDHGHKSWDLFLKENIIFDSKQTLVNYKKVKTNTKKLDVYIRELQGLSVKEFSSFSSDEKLAFWINAYNAFTVKLIIDHYPVKSIKDIGSFFSSPWSKKFIPLFNKQYSLDQIEHETIRKNFKEPRIHFAVNCASIGCPSLYHRAFVSSRLEQQLETVTKQFLSNTNKNRLVANKLKLSKIFDWYGEDFVKSDGSVLAFARKYLQLPAKIKVEFNDYDWKLNSSH